MKLLDHWELKAVSLVLAVALYVYTSGQVRVERTLAVSVPESAIRGLPDDYQISSITPREFKVQLSVPASRLAEIDSSQLTPRLEVSTESLAQRSLSFVLTSQLLRLPNDVRIIATEPADVREIAIQLDRIAEGTLPVDQPRLVGLPTGFETSITVEPTLARIAASGDILELLRASREKLRFQDVDLSHIDANLSQPRTDKLALIPLPPPPEMPYRVAAPITATVLITPIQAVAKELSMPVEVLADKDLLRSLNIDVIPPRVLLTVRGPANLVSRLTPAEVIAYVRLPTDITPDRTLELPVQALAPAWMTVEAGQVQVVIGATVPK